MKTEQEKLISKKLSAKKWRDKNKLKILEKNREYRKKKKSKKCSKVLLSDEEKKKRRKEYREKNREYFREYHKKYVADNFEKISEYHKKYENENKIELNKKNVIRKKNRYINDSDYRIKINIRNLIVKSFKRNGYTKKSKTYDIIGCSFEEFKIHLESMFSEWMNWGNKGMYNGEFNCGWDIDHIIPISSAKTEEDIIRLNHYTNIQPLCSKINRDIKKDRLEYEMD
jgi:hypothetical protein